MAASDKDEPSAPIPLQLIALLLVPVFYSIAVLDLKIIKWVPGEHA